VSDCIKLYLFDEEITQAVKYHFESRCLWKREEREVLEIKLKNPFRPEKEKSMPLFRVLLE
jgi:hypothetical protein